MTFCGECGSQLIPKMKFCRQCGMTVNLALATDQSDLEHFSFNKNTALVLAFIAVGVLIAYLAAQQQSSGGTRYPVVRSG